MKVKIILPLILIFSSLYSQNIQQRFLADKGYQDKFFISKTIRDFSLAVKQKKLRLLKSLYDYEYIKSELENDINYNLSINIKSIELNENSATVICNYIIYDDRYKIIEKSTATFLIQKKDKWKISNINLVNEILTKLCDRDENKKADLNAKQNKNIESSPPITDVNITISDRTFIPHDHQGSGAYDIGYNLTQQYLGVQLFSTAAEIDQTYMVHQINGGSVTDETAFAVDPYWRKIVYCRRTNGADGDILSYGDHLNDAIKFNTIQAIEANEFKEVFVLDGYAKKIYKFNYNLGNSQLTPVSTTPLIDPSYFCNRYW